jgi:hypothetical protein
MAEDVETSDLCGNSGPYNPHVRGTHVCRFSGDRCPWCYACCEYSVMV